MNFDINRMKRSDQVIAVCGALLFISLFLPFFHFSYGGADFDGVHVAGVSHSFAGHSSGFFAWAGLWLGFLAGGLGFFSTLGVPWPPQVPVTKTIATLGVSALATLFLVLRLLIGFHDVSRSFGLFLAAIAAIVQVVFAGLAFKESGEALPTKADFQNLGGGSSPTYQPPTSGGYAPPPPAPGYAPPPSFGTPPPPAQGYAPPPPPAPAQEYVAPSFSPPADAPPPPPPASWQQPPAEEH